MDFAKTEPWAIRKFLDEKSAIGFEERFQRGPTWNVDDRQYFMDTILKKWKTSKIVLWDKGNGKYSCVDGRQRLETIFAFFSDDDDESFPLDVEPKSDFSGKKCKELSPSQIDAIKGYELEVDVIKNALEKPIADYFLRLQVGVPLNGAEKLNAFLGPTRDFIVDMADHKFFTEIVPFGKKRFLSRYLAAQVFAIAKEGRAHNLKFDDLRSVYKQTPTPTEFGELREMIKEKLDYLVSALKTRSSFIKNRATVVSMFYFVMTEYDNLSLASKGEIVGSFFKAFQREREKQRVVKPEKINRELQSYRDFVVQAADTETAIKGRHEILKKRFISYEKRLMKHKKK